MHKSLLTLLFGFCTMYTYAQLVNNNATIVVEAGAKLIVEGDLTNTGGTITNQGTIEIQGSLQQNGTINSNTSLAKIIFSGGDPGTVSGTSFQTTSIELNKTTSDVTFQTDIEVLGDFLVKSTNSGNILLGSNNLIFSENATSTREGGAAGSVVTNGSGVVSKMVDADGTFEFPVGDVSHYSPLELVYMRSGTGNIDVQVDANSFTTDRPSDADAFINRHWDINAAVSGFSAMATGTYDPSDVAGTASLIKGASYDATQPVGSRWSWQGADNATNKVVGDIDGTNEVFTGMNFFGRVNMMAMLQGPFSGGTMTTALNSASLIPLTSPYSDGTVAPSIPADVVDWVQIEVRNDADPSIIESTHSAFLKNDGSIVSIDNNAILPRLKDAHPNGNISIGHRNHLKVRMPNGSNVDLSQVSPALHDFTSGLGQAFTSGSPAMVELASNEYGLWGGDVNGDNQIKYNGSSSDRVEILLQVGFLTPNNVVVDYSANDVNLDGEVKYNGSSSDRVDILLNVGFLTPNNIITGTIPN